jgi:hypothetical protein
VDYRFGTAKERVVAFFFFFFEGKNIGLNNLFIFFLYSLTNSIY